MLIEKLQIIGEIETPFHDKFGIPRQSGMVNDIICKIRLKNKYNNFDAVRGLEGFSYIWVIWGFSENETNNWSPTVRPPRLGGNKRMGVFATRSPNRPNPLGLSSLKLLKIENENGQVYLWVSGADMVNGTPIYDIKPYIPFTDSHQDAKFGFAENFSNYSLDVIIPSDLSANIDKEICNSISKILSLDPRPSYQNDENRIYGVILYNFEIKFSVCENKLTVKSITEIINE